MSKFGENVRLMPCMHKICDICLSGTEICICGESIKRDQLVELPSIGDREPTQEISNIIEIMCAAILKASTHIKELQTHLDNNKKQYQLCIRYYNEIINDIEYIGLDKEQYLKDEKKNYETCRKQFEENIDTLELALARLESSKYCLNKYIINGKFTGYETIIKYIDEFLCYPKLIPDVKKYRIVWVENKSWKIITHVDNLNNGYYLQADNNNMYKTPFEPKDEYRVTYTSHDQTILLCVHSHDRSNNKKSISINNGVPVEFHNAVNIISTNVRFNTLERRRILISKDEIRISCTDEIRSGSCYIIIMDKMTYKTKNVIKIHDRDHNIIFRQIKLMDAIKQAPEIKLINQWSLE